MKVIGLKETSLDACVKDAQHERIVITSDGKPVALMVGVSGLDGEQLQLGSSTKFWELISQRRREKALTRSQLEKKIRDPGTHHPKAAQQNVAAGKRRPVGSRSSR